MSATKNREGLGVAEELVKMIVQVIAVTEFFHPLTRAWRFRNIAKVDSRIDLEPAANLEEGLLIRSSSLRFQATNRHPITSNIKGSNDLKLCQPAVF